MRALKNFRTYFLRGLAALLPTIVTLWIFFQSYMFVENRVSVHVNRWLVQTILLFTDRYSKEFLTDFWVHGPGKITGFFVAIVGVVFIGAFLASVVGRSFWHVIERTLMRAPLIKKVYPFVKQITDFLLTQKTLSFTRVVALQYPRRGVWSVGMVTGTGLKTISKAKNKEFLTVFVPTSPTPFTGYVIMTPRDETIELDMTIEEALRFTISGGVITPSDRETFKQLSESDQKAIDSEK
ncbi:hypothetical protein STSP2_02051 [Anaerohalosphaera lusitana]|uniref:DUF502 domain-containing protein n=1 Tax=Anaerohalosphaera lusitana TaxID=1936003 RepID=A0A1U9NM14_9BACT|nr:DUF502 domain-containing protein [Anaerohalosphaera lusitana]AQT68875.1 hypothetical protein STSP2_02051 [Anaerohalosphaera lusitana]